MTKSACDTVNYRIVCCAFLFIKKKEQKQKSRSTLLFYIQKMALVQAIAFYN